MGINYGTEKIRFTAPVPVGSQVRLKATLRDSERRGDGVLYRLGIEVEIKDAEKHASGSAHRPESVGEPLVPPRNPSARRVYGLRRRSRPCDCSVHRFSRL